MKSFIYGAALLATAGLPALAQESEQGTALAVDITVFEVVTTINDDGEEVTQRIASDNLVPQDTVVISAKLDNTGDEALSEISFKLDVDPSLSLLGESLIDQDEIDFSFSTRQDPAVFADLEDLTISLEDGTERPATADDIGSIQVNLAEIGAAKNAVFEYSATIR